ncbi:hypothetical protein KM043_016407 [Ampulex compressa]|nr:hypothetical protein KM043_016407 [Ampulex compressa]
MNFVCLQGPERGSQCITGSSFPDRRHVGMRLVHPCMQHVLPIGRPSVVDNSLLADSLKGKPAAGPYMVLHEIETDLYISYSQLHPVIMAIFNRMPLRGGTRRGRAERDRKPTYVYHAPGSHGLACSGRTLWDGMGGRRVGAWAAAGRTHVSRREREGLVVDHEAGRSEREGQKKTAKTTGRKKRKRRKRQTAEGREVNREKGRLRSILYIHVWERTPRMRDGEGDRGKRMEQKR